MKKKETLNFRVSAEFKRKLIEEAKKERRSLTNYLEAALIKLGNSRNQGQEGREKGGKGCKIQRRGIEAIAAEGNVVTHEKEGKVHALGRDTEAEDGVGSVLFRTDYATCFQ